jgi:hypothetical protein
MQQPTKDWEKSKQPIIPCMAQVKEKQHFNESHTVI